MCYILHRCYPNSGSPSFLVTKRINYRLLGRLLLLFCVSLTSWCMDIIVTIIPTTVTKILITVTTMLIVSNNVLTFRMYFPHTNISFHKGACMTSHTVQKANRYPLSIAPGSTPIIIISIEHTFVNIIMTIADSFLHHSLKTLPKV